MTDFRDIEALATSNQKISAIKEYRALTGVGLKEAKDAVEHFQAHGQWPAGLGSAVGVAVAAVHEPVARPRPREVIEQFVAQGQIIGAIKEVRSLTNWGLKESKDAVDAFRERGAWSAEALAAFGEPRVAPAPAPVASPSSATIVQDSRLAPLLQALATHLGHAPHVHLTASARRHGHDGHLVMLRDRTCFVRQERGQWLIDPVLFYDTVHHVEIGHGARPTLFVSAGHVHERFELGAAEADAALALFRVFAP